MATYYSFFTTHSHFAPASIVQDENVHLLSIGSDIVRFTKVAPTLDILNLRKNPIFFLAQTMNAKQIIVLPRKIYDTMMESVDVSDREVVWLFHTIRCGSTVWSQIFDSLPGWTVLSETQTMFQSVITYQTNYNIQAVAETEDYEKMTLLMIKSYLMKMPKGKKIFWKTTILDDHMIPIIHKHFSSHKFIFAYRSAKACAASYQKAFGWLPILTKQLRRLMNDLDTTEPKSEDARIMRLWYTNGYDPAICDQAIKSGKLTNSSFEWFVLLWAAKVKMAQKCRESGIRMKPAKYEHLQKDPKRTIHEIFAYLKLSDEHLDVACKAMELDSQAGLFFSQQNKTTHDSWVRTDDAVERCSRLLRVFGLPDLESDFLMAEQKEDGTPSI